MVSVILSEGLHHAGGCCLPVKSPSSDWAMPAAFLPCRRATAGVGWLWFEPAVQPRLQLWGAWLDSTVASPHHGPPCCAKSQTLKPMRSWTAALSSGSQVTCFSLTLVLYVFIICYVDHLFFNLQFWWSVIALKMSNVLIVVDCGN